MSTAALTADTITDEQIRGLATELWARYELSKSNQDYWDIRSAAHALGHGGIFDGVDCRMPLGHEARCAREGRARCAEILNARTEGK